MGTIGKLSGLASGGALGFELGGRANGVLANINIIGDFQVAIVNVAVGCGCDRV